MLALDLLTSRMKLKRRVRRDAEVAEKAHLADQKKSLSTRHFHCPFGFDSCVSSTAFVDTRITIHEAIRFSSICEDCVRCWRRKNQ
jgi:hypothetical protein